MSASFSRKIWTGRLPGRGWALAVLAALGCAGCPGPSGPDPIRPTGAGAAPNDDSRCEVTLPEEQPQLGSPAPDEPARSQWAARVDVALARLRTELDRGLPVELAKGQSKASLGRVSYSVRRQGLELRVAPDELLVDVPVVGQASACVPVGPICPGVGSCSPALRVTAHVPLDLGADLALRAKSVDIEMIRGCVIAGVDASSQIRSGASGYSGKIRQRLNEILPTIRPEMEAAWRELHAAVPLAEGRCALLRPERVVHRALPAAADQLSFAIAIEGGIDPGSSCPPGPSASPALPKASRNPGLEPETRLATPQSIGWSALASELDRSLGAAGPPSPASAAFRLGPLRLLEARAAATASTPLVALRVGLEGSHCGQIWLTARPVLTANDTAVRLEEVTFGAGQPERARLLKDAGIEAWVARHATAPIGQRSDAVAVHARSAIVRACHARSPEPKLELGEAAPGARSISVRSDGLEARDEVRFGPSVRVE